MKGFRFIPVAKVNGRWRADRVSDHKIMQQLRSEAGLNLTGWPDPPDAYDRILRVAGKYEYGLETTGQEP
jgi:hypothetical protein